MSSRIADIQPQTAPIQHWQTSEIAREFGVHPNTIRLYEAWGFLPPVPRTRGGYRLFDHTHLEQLKLARLALYEKLPRHKLQESALRVVRQAASGDLHGAWQLAQSHLHTVRQEREQAEVALNYLLGWIENRPVAECTVTRPIRETAKALHLTIDTLRNWERDGLISVPRHPKTGYRMYGNAEMERLHILRMLRQAGYSVNAILRMVRFMDYGRHNELSTILDTPCPGEEIYSATDLWLSALKELEQRAEAMLEHLNTMLSTEEKHR